MRLLSASLHFNESKRADSLPALSRQPARSISAAPFAAPRVDGSDYMVKYHLNNRKTPIEVRLKPLDDITLCRGRIVFANLSVDPFVPGSGNDTPRDFLERCLARMDEWESRIHAFVSTNIPAARHAADRSSERWRSGHPLSLIDGMPIGVKDIIETADMPTQQGSALFAGLKTNRDSASVAALREAGVVILGKTVTTEFAATEPGPTTNPWDFTRTPGGSSSGSAAAVATGLVSAALGTRRSGSIIRPASYCGCYGFKPSVGGINRGGSFDYLSHSCTGVLAATLEELWIVARAITARIGGDPGYFGISGPMEPPSPRSPRCVVALDTAAIEEASPDAVAIFSEFRNKLQHSGIRVLTRENANMVREVEDAIRDAGTLARSINTWETRWPLNTYARDMDANLLSQTMRGRLKVAETMKLEEHQQRLAERDHVRRVYAQLESECDACITLSATGPAPVGLASTGNAAYAIPASLLGVPAISIPRFEVDGLPLGLQVLGFTDRDADLISVASALREM